MGSVGGYTAIYNKAYAMIVMMTTMTTIMKMITISQLIVALNY